MSTPNERCLARLEKALRGRMAYVERVDGSRVWLDPRELSLDMFRYFARCMRAEYRGEEKPEPPAILLAVAELPSRAERLRALAKLFPSTDLTPVALSHRMAPLDPTALVERGVLVVRSVRPPSEAG